DAVRGGRKASSPLDPSLVACERNAPTMSTSQPGPQAPGASSKRTVRKDFERARTVHPVGITGKERPADILKNMFPAYVGRQERTAFELMQRSSREDTTTFLTFS